MSTGREAARVLADLRRTRTRLGARGDYDEESDIDIAVVVNGLTRELKNQVLDKVAGIEFEYLTPLSVFVLSAEEFEYLKKRERRIALGHRQGRHTMMTEENKRENIKNELDRASKAMDAAILLFENGFLNDAVSRLYYFLLYNIRACFSQKGSNPKAMMVRSGFWGFTL